MALRWFEIPRELDNLADQSLLEIESNDRIRFARKGELLRHSVSTSHPPSALPCSRMNSPLRVYTYRQCSAELIAGAGQTFNQQEACRYVSALS
jgi:hypothetical protein